MTAEAIVRALAATGPPIDSESDRCVFCAVWFDRYILEDQSHPVGQHEPGCPWRQAREWGGWVET